MRTSPVNQSAGPSLEGLRSTSFDLDCRSPCGGPTAVAAYSDLSEAMSMEKRYFTSDLSSLS
jgi:hypothetical protein